MHWTVTAHTMYSSMYIHVPFCSAKCDYCAFYSMPGATSELRRRYIAKLEADFQRDASKCATLDSIFVGGGTPSLLTTNEWRAIFAAIRRNFSLKPDCEFSIEANPDSLSPELISLWAENGVNRLSLGIQSFDEGMRRTIGRRGSLANLNTLIDAIRDNGITGLNLDLIFNIPGQSLELWQNTLRQALAYHPTHISAYSLTLEEGTPLAKRKIPQPDEQFLDFWNATDDILGTQGILRYEISNFALPKQECRHNYSIWHGATYLGCGPAACSFDGQNRFTQPRSLDQWLNDAPPELDKLPALERAMEILAFGMRTVRGWNLEDFRRSFGYDPMALRGPQIRKLHADGLIAFDGYSIAPTKLGLLFNDNVLMELL